MSAFKSENNNPMNCSTLATWGQSSKTTASKLPLKNVLITTTIVILCALVKHGFTVPDFCVARLLQFAVSLQETQLTPKTAQETQKHMYTDVYYKLRKRGEIIGLIG